MEIGIEELEKILNGFSNFYKEYVDNVFRIPYEENPEAFLLYELSKVDAFLLQTDKVYTGNEHNILVFQGTGKRIVYDLKKDDYSTFHKYGLQTTDFLKDVVHKNFETGNFIMEILEDQLSLLEIFQSFPDWYNDREILIKNQAELFVKSHGKSFVEHINHSAKYYADRAYQYIYTDLDFTNIIQAVNNEDFEYALNESLAAYEHNLYLAATSTAGTALENLIIAILDKNSIEFDYNQGTELGRLTNLLLKEEIVNKKMKQRIMNSASLRNLASHANKGRTIREDAKSIYQIIYTLSSEVYLPLT